MLPAPTRLFIIQAYPIIQGAVMPVSPQPLELIELSSLTLFCRVIDNFGDIGICFRLARQLAAEHHLDVTLWVDDLVSFQRICPELSTTASQQKIQGIEVIHWVDQTGAGEPHEVADIVIEFFGCELPVAYVTAMRQRQRPPVWINLEGLSAEDWVEGCHTLPSPQSGLTKYFFYPGFTSATGGLLLETGLLSQREQFRRRSDASEDFLSRLGVTPAEFAATRISLFCYPDAPIEELFKVWQNSSTPITCLVPEGVASTVLRRWTGAAGSATHGALTVRIIAFLAQTDYDQLLWSCDINFVRGEDSLVRAHWAQQPLIWNIYAQEHALHHKKLRAFLERSGMRAHCLPQDALHLAWNGASDTVPDWQQLWQDFSRDRDNMTNLARNWVQCLTENGDLAMNLVRFATSIARESPKLAL